MFVFLCHYKNRTSIIIFCFFHLLTKNSYWKENKKKWELVQQTKSFMHQPPIRTQVNCNLNWNKAEWKMSQQRSITAVGTETISKCVKRIEKRKVYGMNVNREPGMYLLQALFLVSFVLSLQQTLLWRSFILCCSKP